ncbi:unnamed protein product [Symbiodinium sp. CCMP2592]|nr:unnamed protein product [Symbiodinium sp. CCMP2592]
MPAMGLARNRRPSSRLQVGKTFDSELSALKAHADSLAIELSVQCTAAELLRTEVAVLLCRRSQRRVRADVFHTWRTRCKRRVETRIEVANPSLREENALRCGTLLCFFLSTTLKQKVISHWRLAMQREGRQGPKLDLRAFRAWRLQLYLWAWHAAAVSQQGGAPGASLRLVALLRTRRRKDLLSTAWAGWQMGSTEVARVRSRAADALSTLRRFDLAYAILQAWHGALVFANIQRSQFEGPELQEPVCLRPEQRPPCCAVFQPVLTAYARTPRVPVTEPVTTLAEPTTRALHREARNLEIPSFARTMSGLLWCWRRLAAAGKLQRARSEGVLRTQRTWLIFALESWRRALLLSKVAEVKQQLSNRSFGLLILSSRRGLAAAIWHCWRCAVLLLSKDRRALRAASQLARLGARTKEALRGAFRCSLVLVLLRAWHWLVSAGKLHYSRGRLQGELAVALTRGQALERRCLSLGREADALLLLAALGRWRGHVKRRSGLAFLARPPPRPPVQEAWLLWRLLTRQARDAEAALQTSAAEVRQSCRDATRRCLVSMAVLRAWHALVADARHVMQTVAQRKDVEVLLESQKQRALLLLGGRQTQRPLLRILRVWNGLSRERHWRLRIVQLVYTSLLSQSTAILRHCWNLWQSRLHQKSCQRDCVNFLQGGTDVLAWCWRGWKSWHAGQRRCTKALGLSRRYVQEGSLPSSFHAWRTQCLLARHAGTTTLLFRTARPVTSDEFLQHIESVCGFGGRRPFDFVYLPWPRLVIINFSSHQICREAVGAMLVDKSYITKVQSAAYQGLVANLATFCAKGKKGSEGSKLPRIFVDGEEVSFDFAVASFLTEDEVQQQKEALKTESKAKAEKKRGKTESTSTHGAANTENVFFPPAPGPGTMAEQSASHASSSTTSNQGPPVSHATPQRADQSSCYVSASWKEGENFLRLAERLRGLRGFLESSSAVSGRLLLAFALRSWRLAPEAMREQRRLVEARGAAAQELLLRRFLGAWRRGVFSQHRSRLGELAEVKEHQERLAKMLSKRDEQMRSLGVVPWLSGRPIEISGPLVKLMLARWRGWALQVSGDRRQLVNQAFVWDRRERLTNSLLQPSYSLLNG